MRKWENIIILSFIDIKLEIFIDRYQNDRLGELSKISIIDKMTRRWWCPVLLMPHAFLSIGPKMTALASFPTLVLSIKGRGDDGARYYSCPIIFIDRYKNDRLGELSNFGSIDKRTRRWWCPILFMPHNFYR